jgi:hypothetical protein
MKLFIEIPAELTCNNKKAALNPDNVDIVTIEGSVVIIMLSNGKKGELEANSAKNAEKIYQLIVSARAG